MLHNALVENEGKRVIAKREMGDVASYNRITMYPRQVYSLNRVVATNGCISPFGLQIAQNLS